MRVIFAGTPEFSVNVLESLIKAGHDICAVYTQPDRPKGRGRKLAISAIKQAALSHQLPIYQPKSLKGEAEQTQLASFNADIMVVVAYGLILPKKVLEIPRFGCLNVHASLLPKYRGAAPIQAAILNGDDVSGVTIMQMDVGLDTGDMILKKQCAIGENDTAQMLHDTLSVLGADAIVETLPTIENGAALLEKQDDTQANYAGKISKEDALIDWQKSYQEIHNQVRAYYGWPVSHTTLNDNAIRIWQTEKVSDLQGRPGEIIKVDKDALIVSCGEGALSIKQIQLPNSKPMSIKDCLNSKRSWFVVGELFS